MASKHIETQKSNQRLIRERDGTYSALGVWMGQRIGETLFAEPTQDAVWMVRYCTDDDGPLRVGEVRGGRSRYIAYDSQGNLISIERSLNQAVASIERHHQEAAELEAA